MRLAARSRKAGQRVDPVSGLGKHLDELKIARDADMATTKKLNLKKLLATAAKLPRRSKPGNTVEAVIQPSPPPSSRQILHIYLTINTLVDPIRFELFIGS